MDNSPYSPPEPTPQMQGNFPTFKSSPTQAFQAVLQTPNWVANVLWLSLGVLASSVLIGQIAIFGYGAELLERRAGRPENPNVDIDSNRLGDYINKGVWPFLVQLVLQLISTVLLMIPIFIALILAAAVGSAAGGDAAPVFVVIFVVPLTLLLTVGINVITVPFLIRAMVSQDFQTAFDLNWCLNFSKQMLGEIILSSIVFMLLSMCVGIVGILACFVGYFPALGLIAGAAVNLLAQWYEIYLSRGGEPVPGPSDVVDATIVG